MRQYIKYICFWISYIKLEFQKRYAQQKKDKEL